MHLAWVIGSGGLLGGSLVRELSKRKVELFEPPLRFEWRDSGAIAEQIQAAVRAFSLQATNRSWEIYWAAGVGTMHSSEADLQHETNLLNALVQALLPDEHLALSSGTLVFASSAGANYAGAIGGAIGESTPVAPIIAYGRHKLLQEVSVRRLNCDGSGASVVCCRISTIFGIQQKLGKQQGLLTEIARRILANKVIHIYVPLETMRDYIEVGCAAKAMVQSAAALSIRKEVRIQIIASEVSVSVAQILATFKLVCKRNLRIVTSTDGRPLLDPSSTPEHISVGIMNIMTAQRLQFAKHGRR